MAEGASVGRRVEELTTPAFLVDLAKVKTNCANMLATCKTIGVSLRAQTKTHKTIECAVLQTGESKSGLVTSTLEEAEFYARHGFDDILYGYPLIPHHMPRVIALTRQLKKFHVMVDSQLAVDTLKDTPTPGKPWSVFLKVDCGNKRAGVWWEDEAGVDMALQLHNAPNITFVGVYVHCGNTYGASEPKEVLQIQEDTLDVQQWSLGSCSQEDIACCVATRVIGHYPHRNQMLIDCGFVGLTKQGYGHMDTGYGVFRGHPNLKLCAMTQDIGFVEPLEGQLDYEQYPIGSLLYILPWHSCATAALYPVYHVVEGDTVLAEWRPTRGW